MKKAMAICGGNCTNLEDDCDMLKVKRLIWIKENEGWYGQPPVCFRIYKDRKQWRMIIGEFWKKPGCQHRDIPINSLQQGKTIAALIWKNLCL